MKLKLLLPWLCVVGLVAGLGMLYSDNQKQAGELATLKQESQDLRAAAEEAKKAPAESEELVRLRKENADVLVLRNKLNQLRGENQQLSKEATTAAAQAQSAQALIQAQSQRLAAAQTAVASAAEHQAAAARAVVNQAAACINNLRQIDGAKQQWALENKKTAEDAPSASDIAPYLKGNALPACPAGGAYTINAVGGETVCSIPGHALPK